MKKYHIGLEEMFINESIFDPFKSSKTYYVGKTPNLIKAEKLLTEMIDPRMKYDFETSVIDVLKSEKSSDKSFEKLKKSIESKSDGKLNASNKLRQVEKLMCKEFGFKECFIIVAPINKLNAFTHYPRFLFRDMTTGMPSLLYSKNRFYDYNHQYFCSVVLFPNLFDGTFTGGEILATLLHEIGHNFDTSLMSYIADILVTPIVLLQNGMVKNISQSIISHGIFSNILPYTLGILKHLIIEAQKDKDFNKIISIINIWLDIIRSGNKIEFLMDIQEKFVKIRNTIMNFKFIHPFFYLKKISMGQKETFSDSFANIYGYGPELISSLDKIENQNEYIQIKDNHILQTWSWAAAAASTIYGLLYYDHPETQTRCRLILDDMEKVANDENLPPKIRKVAKKNYEATKKAYDKYLEVDPDKKHYIAERIGRYLKEKILFGKVDLLGYLFTMNSAIDGPKGLFKK